MTSPTGSGSAAICAHGGRDLRDPPGVKAQAVEQRVADVGVAGELHV